MATEPASIQNSSFVTDFTNAVSPIIKRPIHILDDGALVAVIPQQNSPDSPYGSGDSVNKIEIWYSPADRSTWTKKATYNLPTAFDISPGAHIHCGSVLLNDGSVYFAWRTPSPDFIIKAVVFSKTATATWTAPGSVETVFTPVGRFPYRLDLDVNRANNRVFLGWAYRGINSTTDTIGADVIVRTAANTYDFITGSYDLGGNAQQKDSTEDFTIAIDPASTTTWTRLAYCVTVVSTTKDYGDKVYMQVVRNSDNTTQGSQLYRTINTGRSASRRSSWLFAPKNGIFTLVGVGGAGAGSEAWGMRFKTSDPITDTTPAIAQVAPITYSPLKFNTNRSNSLFSDVTVTYANDNFNILWHDTSYVYNMPGKFKGVSIFNADTLASVSFETSQYSWDNRRVYDPATGRGAGVASGLYGGARNAAATNMHDVLMSYFVRTSISNKDAAWLHQYNRPSRAPQSAVPGKNTVQNTSLPLIGIYADLDQKYPRTPIRPKIQIAKDAGFTTGLIEYTKSGYTAVNNTNADNTYVYIAEKLAQGNALQSGAWYIRAAHEDSFGTRGAWTVAQPFSVLHKPFASPVSPVRGATFNYGASGQVTFTWTFGDGYEFDSQTAYRILIETNDSDDPVVVLDTGKIASTDTFVTLEIPSTSKNIQLRWSMQVWDIDDTAGDMSDYGLFMVADPPTITITTPVDGSVVDNARPFVQWTYVDPTDSTQAAYRVVILKEGVAVFDSGWKTGVETVFQADSLLLSNESSYTTVLYVRNSIALESSVSSSYTTEWIAPPDPDLSSLFIDVTGYDQRGQGYVLISWANLTADDEFLSWRLYRRYKLSDSAIVEDPGIDWELVHEEFSVSPPLDEPAYTFLDYTAPSGYDVHYTLTQTVMRFGSIVESRKVTIDDLGKMVHLASASYWLIDPEADGNPDDAIQLYGASSDSYTDEYETEIMNIIGRGRHVEIGDRLGYSGSLKVPLRFIRGSEALDGPRRQKLDLERFKAKGKAVILRSPFGDVFMANTGDLQFDRIPGVGSSEFIDVTLPYSEVFK
jgi:hypothetical protein